MKPHHTRSKRPSLQQRKPSRGSIFEALEARIAPAAFTWINPASGAWATAANWSVVGVDADGIPDADDDVTINPATVGLVVTISTGTQTANTIAVPGIDVLAITGGTLTISAASTVSNLTLSGGTLNAGPQLTLTGTSAFSGNPTINGTVRNDDTLSIAGDPNLAGTLDNAGTMTNSGRFDFSGAGRLNNLAGATYEATTANASILSGTTTEGFYNAGTFRASPTGTATVSSLFHNLAGGTIDLTAGTLALHSNGTWTGANFLVSPGALVTLNAGSKTWEGTYTGTGGGIVRLGAGIQGASSGGNMTPGAAGATLNFPAGMFEFADNASISAGGTITNLGSIRYIGFPDFSGTLDNSGTIIAAGRLDMSATAQVNNLAGGTVELAIAGGGSIATGGASGGFFNAGKILVNSAGTQTVSVPFNNLSTGTIEAVTGTIALHSSGTWEGAHFVVSPGALVTLNAGTKIWTGNYTGSGSGGGIVGIVRLGGGTQGVSAGGAVTPGATGVHLNFPAGMFEFADNADIKAGGTVTNLGFMKITGLPDTAAVIENAGTIIAAGQLGFQGTSGLNNLAGGVIQGNPGTIFAGAGSLGVNNAGKILVAQSGTTTVSSIFNNLAGGTIEVTAGILALHSNGTWTGANFLISPGAAVTLNAGTKTWTGIYKGSGGGIVQLRGGAQGIGAGGSVVIGNGGATLDIADGGYFDFADNAALSGQPLVNRGKFIYSGFPNLSLVLQNEGKIESSGRFDYFGSAQIYNKAGGVFESLASGAITSGTGSTPGILNEGTWLVTTPVDASSSASFVNHGVVHASGGGTLRFTGSTPQISGGTLTGGTWIVDAGATLVLQANVTTNNATVELHGNSTQLNAIRTNNGDLTIGRAFTSTTAFTNNGTLTLDPNAVFTAAGTFTQMASGRTEFQLGGAPASGLFGKLSVAGTAALMGTAAFVQVQEYGAKAGDVFPLATFGSKTGQFDAFDGDYAQRTRVFDPVLSATTFVLNSLVSTADLAVTSVTPGAGSLLSGDDITVDYTVTNFQDSPTFANEWVDSIYLSLDDRIDPGDKLIGRVTHTGFVDANGSYSGSITVPLPGVLPGDYRVLVVTDSRGLTPDSDRSNNAFASSPIITDIRSLTSGVVVNGTVQAGQDVWYRIDLPAGKTQGFDFTSTVIGGAELYLNHVSLPSLSDYDKVLASSQQTVFSTTLPVVRGTTYLLVHGTETAGAGATFTLSAKGLDFGVFALDHDTGALGAGTVTTTIHGSLLTPGTTYSLIPDVGTPIAAQQVYYLDSSTAWATFDLTNAVAGTYDIRADDGGTSATLPDAYHVIVGKGGDFEFSIYTPSYIRPPFRNAVLTFDYENTGFTDVPAPLMLILAQNTLLKLPDDPAFGNGDLQFLAVNPDGPAGILQPGSRGRIEIEFVPVNQSAHAKSKFVALVSNGADFTFQWDEMKDSFQPPNIPDDAWSAIFSNFKTQVGDNAETLRTALADDATRLSQMGIRTASVAKLIGYELEEADNFGAISQRYEIGALGRGQAGPFSMHAITELAGTVTIVNGDQHRIFFKNGSSFKGANGDPGVLTRDVNGALHLREFTGEEVIFRASDGRLDRFLSANGFQTTVNYDISGQIVGAVDGNGDTVAFTYNPQGRIATVTDAVGKVTIIGYDASGEHLTSIVTSRGTTSLTYVTGQGPALDHAVASITFRDGTSVFYQYDTRGRLINAAGDGGALATSFAYDATGGMSATNLLGDTTTSWHVPGGSIGQTFHANGLVSSFLRNGDGDRVYGFTDGTSLTVEKTEGHLTLTNSLGQKTNYDIGGSPLRANSLTNPNGYATTFDHDNFGNLTAIIGPDGGTLHFTYDGHGNRTTFINERGQLIGYTYDAHDLLTRKNLPDGTHVDYAYDAHRNLTSASMRAANNADLGTTSYEYNAQDRMTKVTYPGGKFLDFTYDAAGRRATVSDGTFTERYAYDALGRLARVSDTAAATLIAYTYDSVGRLATETRGNGTTTAYAYDSLGRNTSIVHRAPDNSVTESFAYTYDAGNHVLTSTTLNGTTTYGYDLTGQLNRVELPGGRIINYAYDANGNRKTVNDTASGTEYYTTNILDEYSATDGATFLYDADGNLVRKNTAAGSTLYQYDASGRLAQTSGPDGTTTYLYDALGNRIATTKDGVRTDYLIDPAGYGNVFAEYDNGGNLVAHYAHGLGLASRVDAGGAAKFYHYDITGNTQLLTANDGSVQATYEYLPFGEKIGSTGTAENAYTFNGRFGVEDRGDGLYDMRARSYDPEIGRFTQQDPLNVLAGDTNLYRYVNNNPVSFVDPTGLVLTEAALLAEQLAAYEAAFAEAALLAEQLAAYKAAFASAYAGSELAAAEAAALLAESAAPVLVAAAAETTVVAGTTTAVVGGTTTAVSGTTTAAAVVTTAVALPTALAGTLILGGTDIALRIFAPDLHDAGTQAVGDAFFGDAQDVINHETENHILDEHRAPQVQKYIDKIAADPANPTIEELSRAERLARFEAELATYNRARLLHELYPDVYPDPGPEPSLTSSSEVILPNDPNNILGPSGSGADQIADDPETQPFRFDGFVRPTGLLGYTILFENKPSASAPAQQVIVTQTLDADLDISTFRFGSFGWGDFKVTAPADASGTTFHQRVDATATLGIFVDVDATLNVNTHELRVVFTSLDATTLDLPLDPFAGFLPANITPPEGDGFVTYRVEPKADLPNRTRIDGLATIIFDTEAAINTPLIHNLIDSAAPVSNITPFARATTSRNVFRVNWTASDDAGGSGLADVGIYYTDNDGPLQTLIVATAGGDFRFGGETGHTYKFFSIAHDEVGNTEAFAQANPDATISVIAPTLLPVGKKRIFFDADGDKYTVKYSGPGTANIVLLDPDGDGKGSIDQIFVDGTPTTKSKLSVTVKKNKNGGDGIVNIGDLTVAGSLGSFSAKQSNIIVNGITATGTIKSIAIRDLLREDPFLADPLSGGVLTEITLGGINVDKTAITARTIADGFALSTPGTVTLFNAASIGDGAITARALGKLTTTLGAMNADLTIAGAVGSVTIKGGVNVSQWTVGSIGAVTIGGSLEGDIDASGLVKSVTVKNGALNGQVTGATIGAVSVTGGGFGGFIGSSAAPGKVKGLGSLTITGGDLTGSVLVNGNSGPITVRESKAGIGGNISGPITANSFGAITLLGGGLSGALNATGTALALGKTLALAKLTVTGGDLLADVRLFGGAGAISVKSDKLGNGGNITDINITAAKIAALSVARDITDSIIMAGADLGADHELGGGDDTFAAGSIGKVIVGRNVATSTIGAGLSTTNAILKDGDDTILGGVASAIAGLIVKGTADSASYFAAGKFGAAPTIGGIKPNITTDIRFLVP